MTQGIVAWQPVLTDHQAHTLRAMARASGRRLTALVLRQEDRQRKAQGWTRSRVAGLDTQRLARPVPLLNGLGRLWADRTAIHLFGSPFESPTLIICLMVALALRCRVYLISEPYSPIGLGYLADRVSWVQALKSRLRPWIYRLYGFVLRRRVAGVFAISPLAIDQYRDIGIPNAKIVPFGYFVPPAPIDTEALPPAADQVRLIYVGSLIRRKGIDLLAEAVRRVNRDAKAPSVTLDVYGPGDPALLGRSCPQIRYGGTLPFGDAQGVMAGFDAVVVPSRYDGWGVAVNEALLAGTPVICTTAVGAGVLVTRSGAGRVVAASADALAEAIRWFAADTQHRRAMQQAANRTGADISPELGAAAMWSAIASGQVTPEVPPLWHPAPNADSTAPLAVSFHLTNIHGTGATQVMASLLPAFERSPAARIQTCFLPHRGPLSRHRPADESIEIKTVRRRLPNAMSRIVECLFAFRHYRSSDVLIVFGDLPLRCRARQVVFVQQAFLAADPGGIGAMASWKFAVARRVFRWTARFADAFIVQTPHMKALFAERYPEIADRMHVVPQPVPEWLLRTDIRRTGRIDAGASGLRLFYPAADYPHKNHRFLSGISHPDQWPVDELVLTIDPETHPAPNVPWIDCKGFFDPQVMRAMYHRTDALLFLSTHESYGLPLVEAMSVGLPIICPDLPYARHLCGGEAIYFDPRSIESLHAAVLRLVKRIDSGWWPDWSARLAGFPRTWDAVADGMIRVARGTIYPMD